MDLSRSGKTASLRAWRRPEGTATPAKALASTAATPACSVTGGSLEKLLNVSLPEIPAQSYLPRDLVRWTQYPLDGLGFASLYVGLDVDAEFQCVGHVVSGSKYVRISSEDMSMLRTMDSEITNHMAYRRCNDRDVFFTSDDHLELSIAFTSEGTKLCMSQTRFYKQQGSVKLGPVLLSQRQLRAMFDVRFENDFARLADTERPDVLVWMRKMATYMSRRWLQPGSKPAPGSGSELYSWFLERKQPDPAHLLATVNGQDLLQKAMEPLCRRVVEQLRLRARKNELKRISRRDKTHN